MVCLIKSVGEGLRFPVEDKVNGQPTDTYISNLEIFERNLRQEVERHFDKVPVRIYREGDLLGRIASALSQIDISLKREENFSSHKWGQTKIVYLGSDTAARTVRSQEKKTDLKSLGKWDDSYHTLSVLTGSIRPHDVIFALGEVIYIATGETLEQSKAAAEQAIREKMDFRWV